MKWGCFIMDYANEIEDIKQDYEEAVMTLLWCIHDGQRKLIFASIELFPNECRDFLIVNEQSVQVRVGAIKPYPRIFFRRIKMTIDEALSRYRECLEGKFSMIWEGDKDKNGQVKQILSSSMMEMPMWPNFTVSKNTDTELCPFLPESWGMCRVHHLLSKNPDPIVMQLVAHEKSLEWMKERLLWDISKFPELIGSMHLILPNPIYRYVEEKLVPSVENSAEKVCVSFALRKGQSVKGLKVLTVERMPFGIVNLKEHDIDKPNFKVGLSGKAEEFATAIISEKYGLLEYTDFGSFLRGITINMGIVNAIRQVNLPGSDDSYQVSLTENMITQIGEKNDDNVIDLGPKLRLRSWKKKNEALAEKLEQHLFENGTKKKAVEFIADIIQKARIRVIVVDPYFSTVELYNYIYRISSRTVSIEIITSAEILKDKSEFSNNIGGNRINKGRELLRDIQSHEKDISAQPISVYVMTGTPMIHDRFLVVDDNVWFSGNSLNNIGERASMIIQLPNPDDIIRLIDDTRNNKERIKPLEEWLKSSEKDCEKPCLIKRMLRMMVQLIRKKT